jgi:hypothetical protein
MALIIPIDGRLTSQNVLTGPLTGGEVMPIVSPGNAAQGNSYQVTTLIIAQYAAIFAFTPTIIATTYNSVATDTRILINLNPVNPITVTLLSSASYIQPVLIKDIGGTLTNVNTATIDFSGGQTADGLASITLSNAYAGIWLNPLASGGWYITNA